jgi:hypothetical protein
MGQALRFSMLLRAKTAGNQALRYIKSSPSQSSSASSRASVHGNEPVAEVIAYVPGRGDKSGIGGTFSFILALAKVGSPPN